MDPFVAMECTSPSGRLLIYDEDNGETVALRVRNEYELAVAARTTGAVMAADARTPREQIRASLIALKDVYGIAGSFVFARGGYMVARELPAMFDDLALHRGGQPAGAVFKKRSPRWVTGSIAPCCASRSQDLRQAAARPARCASSPWAGSTCRCCAWRPTWSGAASRPCWSRSPTTKPAVRRADVARSRRMPPRSTRRLRGPSADYAVRRVIGASRARRAAFVNGLDFTDPGK